MLCIKNGTLHTAVSKELVLADILNEAGPRTKNPIKGPCTPGKRYFQCDPCRKRVWS